MQINNAIDALGALAQPTRLETFRLLVTHGSEGLPVNRIAEALGSVNLSTLSRHLSALKAAGLLAARREDRRIFYAVDFARARDLLAFLMEDCCANHPAICCGVGGSVNQPGQPKSEE